MNNIPSDIDEFFHDYPRLPKLLDLLEIMSTFEKPRNHKYRDYIRV